jgi:putative glutamine amidotransferase
MKTVATWMREKDEALFACAFTFAPQVQLLNARTSAIDPTFADALLLTGGGDVGPQFLAQPIPDPSPILGVDSARDQWEFAALQSFFRLDRPILAICRGHQVLNVALGGTLMLDIPDHGLPEQSHQNVQRLRHAVGVPASRTFPGVNSSHHQAVDRLGVDLEIEAWCVSDGIVEQMRHRSHPWCVGVQYHPERHPSYEALFRSFIEACR